MASMRLCLIQERQIGRYEHYLRQPVCLAKLFSEILLWYIAILPLQKSKKILERPSETHNLFAGAEVRAN